jgi:FKBP-type peptidyl-prolyl cis-trans isomerase
VRFKGMKIDGQPFDRSPEDGTPIEMALDKLVPGMAEALQLMPAGSQWILYLPADLAFGERGPMADQVAIFDLELVEVVGK